MTSCPRCGARAIRDHDDVICLSCGTLATPRRPTDAVWEPPRGESGHYTCAHCGREFWRDAGQIRRELRRRPYARLYCRPECAQEAAKTRRQTLMEALYHAEPGIRIYHGDARAIVPAIVGSYTVDHVFTDPPYSPETHAGAQGAGGKRPAGELVDFAPMAAAEIGEVLGQAKPRRWVVATTDYRHVLELQDRTPAGLKFIRFGVWVKPDSAPQFTGDRPAQGWEGVAILHGVHAGPPRWNSGGDRAVWVHARARPAHHPTEKPIGLIRQWILQFTDPGDLILDPFMGSGVVLRAAKDLGRQAIGIEIEERWCAHARDRLAQTVFEFAFDESPPEPAPVAAEATV